MKDLASGSISAHLTKLTIPMFLGISSMILAAMVDVIYIGRIDINQLAALGFCFPLAMISISVSMGVSTAATSMIARLVGAGLHIEWKQIATYSFLLSWVISLLFAFSVYLASTPLLSLFGATGDVLQLAVSYVSIWLIGYPLLSSMMFLSNIMRAVGEAWLPGVVIFCSALLQAGLAPFLIFGWAGLPRMELEGAGWSFVVSKALVVFWPLYLVIFQAPMLTLHGLSLAKMLSAWKEILRISLPAMVTNLIGPISLAVVIVILASHGPLVIASFSVASRIEALSIMVLMALASSVIPVAGQNWGAKEFRRAQQSITTSYRFSLIYGAFIAILLIYFGQQITSWVSNNSEVQSVTYTNLLWTAGTFGLLGTVQVSASVFLALGRAKPVLIMGAVRILLIYIPLIWVGDHYFGYTGAFAAIAATNVLMGAVAYLWSRAFFRRQLALALSKRHDLTNI